jgi:feruloyl esterase
MAKSVIHAAYGRAPDRSYIGGCSNGGRHAMVAAARYAEEYDGYLIGAPGFNLPQAAVASIYGAQQYATVANVLPSGLPDLPSAFTTTERRLLSAKVLERCDALDGLADGLVHDVAACQQAFDLARDVPTCPGARDGTCLSAAQKTMVANIFAGPKDRKGRPIYSTFSYDAGHGAGGTAFWEFTAPLVLDSGAVGFVFGTPPADPATFNGPLFTLTSDVNALNDSIYAEDRLYTEAGMSFMTPPKATHLQRVWQRGGRIVVYHGVSDPIFSVDDTTEWFTKVTPRGHHTKGRPPSADAFVRLFHVPGMNHCSGGPATDQFDLLSALVAWVERGEAPDHVVAKARGAGNPGGVNPELPAGWAPDRTRPLCAYPSVATYQSGDPERAASFACR